MIRGRTGLIIQIIGVLTLILGNFFTAGQAVADVATTDEVAVENARFEDDHRQMVANTQVGKKANLAFDLTVGALSQNGAVKFDYDEEALNIKKRRYKYSNGNTAVVVDIDGKDSVVHWRHAVGKTSLDIKLPVKFNRAMTQHPLAIAVDHKLVQLPMMTVLAKGAKVDQQQANSASGNLQADNKINAMLQQEKSEQAAETVKKEAKEQQPESEQKDNQNGRTNRERSEAYLAKKKKADQEQAREKSKQAVEQKKEAQKTDQASATNDLSGDEAAIMTETSRTPRSVGGMTDLKDVLSLADKDDDPDPDASAEEGAQGADIQRTVEQTNVFEARAGRDLSQFVKSQFFTKINLNIDGDNFEIPAALNKEIKLPERIHNSSKNVITWYWDTATIESMNEADFEILDGDYYDFKLSGFTYDYNGKPDVINEIRSSEGKLIGTFVMAPHKENGVIVPDKHDIRITFKMADVPGHTTVSYGTSMTTQFSGKTSEITFGEIAGVDGKITVEPAKITLSKDGKYATDKNGVVDYSKVYWKSQFNVESKDGADTVELTDSFGSWYKYQYKSGQTNSADHKITVIGDKGGKVTITSDKVTVTENGRTLTFTFDAKTIFNDGQKIEGITIETTGDITDASRPKYENSIQVTNCKIEDDTLTSGKVTAEIVRKDDQLKKTAKVKDGGNIEYTVMFTVDENTKNFTLTDFLSNPKFNYADVKGGSYKLYYGKDSGANLYDEYVSTTTIGKLNDLPSLTINFNDQLVNGTYYLHYEVEPKQDATNEDYQNLKNTVNWNSNQSYTTVQTPRIDSKQCLDANWQKMTTDWRINVNQINREVTTPFKIIEPAKETDKYLDFNKFYKDMENTGFNSARDHIKIYDSKNAQRDYYMDENGTAYWDEERKQKAFEVIYDDETNEMILEVKQPPEVEGSATYKFSVGYFGVPFIKQNLPEWGFTNHAVVNYNDKDNEVSAWVGFKQFVRDQIAKSGELSDDFHTSDDRYIKWRVTFNHRNNLSSSAEENLKTTGINIEDVVGEDEITRYIDGKEQESVKKDLQNINDIRKNLKVSLAPLNEDGSGIETPVELTYEEDYLITEETTNDHKTEFVLKLTKNGFGKYKDGNVVFVLDFQAKVPSLKTDDEEKYEHLKKWVFNNKVNVSIKDENDQDLWKKDASAHVSYTDNGHLLDKSGQNVDITQEGQDRTLPAIKWSVLLNGECRKINSQHIQVTDKIKNLTHHHLITQDKDLQVKVFEAERSLTDKPGKPGEHEVTYKPGNEIDSSNYSVKYEDDLSQMDITFNKDVIDGKPIFIQYYTVREKSTSGTSYENKVTLKYGEETIIEEEKIESEITSWGSYSRFAVNVVKTAAQTKEPLQGVKFALQRWDETKKEWVQATYKDSNNNDQPMVETTNGDGMASFNNLGDRATYRIVETQGHEGFYTAYKSKPFGMDDLPAGHTVLALNVENPKMGDLVIKKKVSTHSVASPDDNFKFEVAITDKNGNTDVDFEDDFSVEIDGELQEDPVLFRKGISQDLPTIKDGQRIRLIGLPTNAYFRVTEVNGDGYRTTHTTEQLDKVRADGDDAKKSDTVKLKDPTGELPGIITFINKQKQNQFEFEKVVSGKTTEEWFKFEISTDGETKKAVTDPESEGKFEAKVVNSSTNNLISEGTITFNDKGVATEYTPGFEGKTDKIQLQDGQKMIVSGLPDKATEFLIQEVGYGANDWDVYNHINGEYERKGDEAKLVVGRKEAKNSVMFRNIVPNCVPFTLKKAITGNISKDAEFNFNLVITNPRSDWESTKDFQALRSGTTKEDTITFTKNEDSGNYETQLILHGNESITFFMIKELEIQATEVEPDEKYNVSYKYDNDWTSGNETSITTGSQENCGGCLPPLVFKNHLPGGSLKISKVVVADDLTNEDKQRDFKFKVLCDESMDGKEFATTKFNQDGTTSDGTLKFNDSSSETISLRHGESLEIHDLPTDVKFAVQELTENGEAHGFKVSHRYEHGVEQEKDKTIDFNLEDAKRSTVLFKNTRLSPKTANLQINKQFAGSGINEADHDRNFDFTITSDEMLNEKFTAQKQHQSGRSESITVDFVRGVAKVSLKAGESLNITGLPIDYHYQVTETRNAEFATTYQVNKGKVTTGNATQSFKLLDQQNGQVTFTNTKDKPTTTELTISKKLAGNHISSADKDRSFKFVLYTTAVGDFEAVKTDRDGDNHEVTITIRNGISDSIELKGDESLRIKGLPTTARYQVGEAFTTDFAASYQVNGASVLDGLTTKQFKLTKDRPGTVAFTNTKDKITENGAFAISKFVNADGDRNRAFQFNVMLTDGAGNPLNGTFAVNKITNGVSETGQLTVIDGKTTFTLKHGQTLVIHAPLGVRYEIAEHRYTQLGYTTTATKNNAAVSGSTVTGTVTMIGDHLVYHNDIQDTTDSPAPLPGLTDNDDSNGNGSADLEDPDGLPGQTSPSGTTSGSSGIQKPMGMPSQGYTSKAFLPQTGDDLNQWLSLLGVVLGIIGIAGMVYIRKRKV